MSDLGRAALLVGLVLPGAGCFLFYDFEEPGGGAGVGAGDAITSTGAMMPLGAGGTGGAGGAGPSCGNGTIESGEDCDDGPGNSNVSGGCRLDCKTPFCGDGLVQGSEHCDDGNFDGGDGCSEECTLSVPWATVDVGNTIAILGAGTGLWVALVRAPLVGGAPDVCLRSGDEPQYGAICGDMGPCTCNRSSDAVWDADLGTHVITSADVAHYSPQSANNDHPVYLCPSSGACLQGPQITTNPLSHLDGLATRADEVFGVNPLTAEVWKWTNTAGTATFVMQTTVTAPHDIAFSRTPEVPAVAIAGYGPNAEIHLIDNWMTPALPTVISTFHTGSGAVPVVLPRDVAFWRAATNDPGEPTYTFRQADSTGDKVFADLGSDDAAALAADDRFVFFTATLQGQRVVVQCPVLETEGKHCAALLSGIAPVQGIAEAGPYVFVASGPDLYRVPKAPLVMP